MALKTRVKLSSICGLATGRYAAGMMVDYAGFDLSIGFSLISDIAGWMAGIPLVAEGINSLHEADQLADIKAVFSFIEVSENYYLAHANKSERYFVKLKDLNNLSDLIHNSNIEAFILPSHLSDNLTQRLNDDLSNIDKTKLFIKLTAFNPSVLDEFIAYGFGIDYSANLPDDNGMITDNTLMDFLEYLEKEE